MKEQEGDNRGGRGGGTQAQCPPKALNTELSGCSEVIRSVRGWGGGGGIEMVLTLCCHMTCYRDNVMPRYVQSGVYMLFVLLADLNVFRLPPEIGGYLSNVFLQSLISKPKI